MVYTPAIRVMLVLLLCLSACFPISPHVRQQLTFARVVDLSHVIRGDMPHLPGHPMTDLVQVPAPRGSYVSQMALQSGTSLLMVTGTQYRQVWISDLLPADLVAPVVVLDMRDHAQDHADYRLSICDILAWERQYGQIPPGMLVLLVTGWDMRWGSPEDYLNLRQGQIRVPGFDAAAIAWLVQQRAIRGVGLDAPVRDLARGFAQGDQSSRLRAEYLILENLTNLEQVPPVGAMLLIGVLKVEAYSVAPARVLALVP